jgi:hypothetical protein
MISNVPYNQKNNKPNGQAKTLVAIRSGSFYGIKYEKVKSEPSSYKRGIVASPNFYFYDNFTKVMVDFSDYKNTIKQDIVDEFFNLTLSGATFTVSEGDWINDSITSKKISMSGTYTFTEYKNNILFANVASLSYYDTNVQRYDKNYFVATPNFILSVSTVQNAKNQTNIVNILGKNSKNSFSYLGAQIGDFIEILNLKSKYQIANITVDEEGKEIVTVNGTINEQDRTTSLTDFILYIDNFDKTDVNSFNREKIGRCSVSKEGVLICLDSQTEAQCQLRKNSNFKETATFTENSFCIQPEDISRELSPTERLTIIAEQNSRLLSQAQTNNIATNRRII